MLQAGRGEEKDVPLLTNFYDRAFLKDFQRYGQCPGYGRSQEQMRDSLRRMPKQILLFGGVPVGVLSYERRDDGSVYLGCLCIVPEMQGRGLGTRAFAHMLEECPEVHRFELVTPADKVQNIAFIPENADAASRAMGRETASRSRCSL